MTVREEVTPRTPRSLLVLAVVVVAGIAGVWLLGGRSLDNLGRSTLAIGGAGLVAWWSTRRPVAAFGVLFLLASLSGWTIQLPAGNMRLEQPAIAAGLIALLLARRLPDPSTLRRLWPTAAAFAVYLGALTASSLLYSPDRADSLRMVVWTALSIAGGLLVFLLLLGRDREGGPQWMRGAAAGQAAVGIAVAVAFSLLGPVIFAGPDPVPGFAGKVFALSWEPNIYASLLTALSLFAIEKFRAWPRPANAAVLVLILLGLAVGLTRGAYLGLAAGLIVYAGVILHRKEQPRSLLLPASVVIGALVIGAAVAPVMLRLDRYRNLPIDLTMPGWGRGVAVGPYLLPALPGHSLSGVLRADVSAPPGSSASPGASPEPAVTASPGASPTPVTPTPLETPPAAQLTDTLTFRLDRIPQAIQDWRQNPIIGVGSNSFGQRHLDPTQIKTPDHIAILAVAALYESGVVGGAGLTLGFALILLALWRASRRSAAAPMAAAYLGSIISLLVAYQATNALNFSLIWLISGAGLALAFSATTRVEDRAVSPGPS
jgi:hypothetical protein